jgi:hypothetical protein
MRQLTFLLAQATNKNSESAPADKDGAIDTDATSILESVDNIWDGFLGLLPQILIGAVVFGIFYFASTTATASCSVKAGQPTEPTQRRLQIRNRINSEPSKALPTSATATSTTSE